MKRNTAKSFQDLIVWQKAHQFVLSVFHYSDYFPQKEIYGLTPQLRQAATSIATSIAEGFAKEGRSLRAGCMNSAQDSIEKCRYYLVLAKDLGYGDNPELPPQLEEVSKLLEQYKTATLTSDS